MDCHFLSHGININADKICDCCVTRDEKTYGMPIIMELQNIEDFDYDKLFELKKTLKKEKIQNETKCKGCLFLTEREDFSKDDNFISYINFNHWNICNAKCIYCGEKHYGGKSYRNILPFIKGLIKTGKFKPLGEITFEGGEPTLLPEFEELLTLFEEYNMKVRIHSSGIKYSQAIENGIKRNLVTVIISPDSGEKETYEKIKKVKQFDRVWENIKKYSSVNTADNIKAKMIIIPGVNDSIQEVDSFFKKVIETNIKNIIIDVEAWYGCIYNYNLPNIRFLMEYMKYKSQQHRINFELYNSAIQTEESTKAPVFPTEEKEIKRQYEKLKEEFLSRNVRYV